MCARYFNVKVKSAEQAAVSIKEEMEEEEDVEKDNRTVAEKVKDEVLKVTDVAKAAVTVAVEKIKSLKNPRQPTRWEGSLSTNNHSQSPAAFDEKKVNPPVMITHKGHGFNVYTSCANFSRRETILDRYAKKRPSKADMTPYHPFEFGEGKWLGQRAALEKRENIYTMTLHGFEPFSLRQKECGLVPLPVAMSASENRKLIPLEAYAFLPDVIRPVFCEMYFDSDGNLYFDPSPLPENCGAIEVEISYVGYSHYSDFPSAAFFETRNSALMKRVKPYLRAQPKPEIDKETAQSKYNFDPELRGLIKKWKKLSSSAEKVHAVQSYLKNNYGYGAGALSKFRIFRQRGKKPEQVSKAREGNCFDVNDLMYIVLTKIGVPVRLHTGYSRVESYGIQNNLFDKNLPSGWQFVDGSDRDIQADAHEPFDLEATARDVVDVDTAPIGTRVFMKDKEWKSVHVRNSTTNGAHAFCTYFDDEDEQWKIADATPFFKKKYMMEKKARREKEEKNLAEFESLRPGIEQTRGIPSYEKLREKHMLLQKQCARIVAFLTPREGYSYTFWKPPANHQPPHVSNTLMSSSLFGLCLKFPPETLLQKIKSDASLEEKIKFYEQFAASLDKAMDGMPLILARIEEFLEKICIPLGNAVAQRIDAHPPHLTKKERERFMRIFENHFSSGDKSVPGWKQGLHGDDIFKYGLYTLTCSLLEIPSLYRIGVALRDDGAYHMGLERGKLNTTHDIYRPQDFLTALDHYLEAYEVEVLERLQPFLNMIEDPSFKIQKLILKLNDMANAVRFPEEYMEGEPKAPSTGVQKFLDVFRYFLFGESAGIIEEQNGERGVVVESEGRKYFLQKIKKDTPT